jgi:hypothetical protein
MTSEAAAQALQRVLAAPHAAVYGYPVIGVALRSPAQVQQARQLEARHRFTRDQVMAQLAAHGVDPVPAEASYVPAQPVKGPADAQRWALALEDACASAYRYLLVAPLLTGPAARSASPSSATSAAASTAQAGLRRQALAGLTAAALAATEWRSLLSPSAPTAAFPGL